MITVKVEAAFGYSMLDPSPVFVDLSDRLRDGSTTRGRSSVDQRFDTGTADLLLDNRDGALNVFNTSSVYAPDVVNGTPIRITAELDDESTVYPLFYGSARAWTPRFPTGNIDATVSVPLADGFYTLNAEDLGGHTYPAQSTTERIEAVLDDIGWPAALRNLDTPLGSVQATSFAQPSDGGENSALAHLLDVAEAEAGILYMSPAGEVVFKNRLHASAATPLATYTGSDDYSTIEPLPDDAVRFNVIRIAREDGAQIEYDGSGGKARRVLTRDVMPMENDAQALNVAEWLYSLFGEQRMRIDDITLKPLKDAQLLEDMVTFDLRDVVTFQQDPPGSGDTLDVDCAIEQITHEFPPGDWTTTWSVSPLVTAETQSYWILGTSELGISTRLA